ncbi:MAG: PQQ-like beta-propeller repeat protein [Gemmataceae bacterium]|nr:PQQ-like beta-propeller repeat protein [Gemmataceae bacterium]
MTRLLPPVGLVLAFSCTLSAADWPQWRGPNRDGVAPGVKLPDPWPDKPPEPKWKAAVGLGHSGPSIAGGRVFIMGLVEGNERCLALDADTGKELWKVEYPEPFEAPDPTAGKGPGATPTVDRDRVYMFGLGGQLHCLEVATGQVLWKHDCPKEYWGVKKGPLGDDAWFPPCGATASPLADGDTVIVNVGGAKAGAFTAFDRKSGEIVWKALDDRSSYASPVVRSPGGVEQLICFTGTRMVGLRHADRELLWEVPFPARFEQTIVSPVVWEDLVLVAGEGKATTAVRLKGDGSTVTKEEAWKNDDLKTYLTTPVAHGDHLFGHDMRTGKVVCVKMATGETAWTSARVPGKYHSLVLAGGALLVLNSEGELFVFKADPKECVQLGKWTFAEKGTWGHLAVAGGRLYVKGKENLFCYELPS